jgi:light-regulated signal transduction histidine kinase (bacteriophytochrome)
MPDPDSTKAVVFLPSTEFAVERVFPIRNLVGDTRETLEQDDPSHIAETADDLTSRNAGQPARQGGVEGIEDSKQREATPKPTQLAPPYPDIPPERSIRKPSHPESELPDLNDGDGHRRWRTERTKLIPTTSGAPDVLPGIVSEHTIPTFRRCEDEPIHTPGAIQQYGVLLALKFTNGEDQDLEVRIASENSEMLLGYGPEQLFQLESFLDILEPETGEDALERINNALASRNDSSSSGKTEDTQLDVFAATIISPCRTQIQLWCALHIANGSQDLVILEFEPYTEIFSLSEVDYEMTLPENPIHTVDIEIQQEEKQKSTTRKSTPLRVLEIARRKKNNGVPSMDIFNAMTQAQQQLAGAKSVQQVLDLVVGITAELTGFHRVMFYRFDSQKNGCVDAELVNPRASNDLYRGKLESIVTTLLICILGLHFPASDIPKQARELYKLNRIRILYDRDAETARLVSLLQNFPFSVE